MATAENLDDRDGGTTGLGAWVPADVDVNAPNAARMYDYALGGCHNFAVDRAMVERAEAALPGARLVAHANRAFLARVVRWLVAAGVRQFLDLGSGIPTLGNVHEVAQQGAPDARVVYVDVDPVAEEHGRALLADNPLAGVLGADIRRPSDILDSHVVHDLLDFSQQVAVLMFAVLHFVPDADDPAGIVARFVDAVPVGSYLALSHGSPPPQRLDDAATVQRLYQRTSSPLHLRDRSEVAKLVGGLEIVEPGIVAVGEWHPDPEDGADLAHDELLGVVARKTASTRIP